MRSGRCRGRALRMSELTGAGFRVVGILLLYAVAMTLIGHLDAVPYTAAAAIGAIAAIWPNWSAWVIILLIVLAMQLTTIVWRLNWIGELLKRQAGLTYILENE